MAVIPSNLTRAPNSLMTKIATGGIGRTQLGLLNVANQLSSGKAITSFSDDGVKASAISTLKDSIARRDQQSRNLQHADAALNSLDQALADSTDLVNEARTIASQQVNFGSSPEERQGQAVVVNSLISGLFQIANRQSVSGYIFGGNTPGTAPIESLFGGYRYMGQGAGLLTDIDLGQSVPITLGEPNPIGETSARVRGDRDLDPGLTADTRLSDLNGARGVGVRPGVVEFAIDSGTGLSDRIRVDLTNADTAGQAALAIQNAIRDYEAANSVTVLGSGGVSVAPGGLRLDMIDNATGADPRVQFFDPTGGRTASDLGLTGTPTTPVIFSAASRVGQDLQAKLTLRTPVSALRGVTGPLGSIRINSLGQGRTVDLSSAQTFGDIANLIEGSGLGLRVEVNADGTGFDVLNEVASTRVQALSIEELPQIDPATNLTATRLGIRTLTNGTRLADFNDGRGVKIIDGVPNPAPGGDPRQYNTDLRITLGDGRKFDVDLRPQDMLSVQTLIDRINSEAANPAAVVPPPDGPVGAAPIVVGTDFVARLGDSANGIELWQPATANTIQVAPRNNSLAAENLGLLDGRYDPATGTFRAADRAKVRVDNLFTALLDLREALATNDTFGITLAGEKIESMVDRVSQSRAVVGGLNRRVVDGKDTQEELKILDERTRSVLEDLDFTEATSRLSQLQTQLQAGYIVTQQLLSRSLLDFLG